MEDFNFKKKFGQNFLKDEKIIERIATCADIKEKSLVIEVGPGKGVLTKYLAKYADHVLCYEIDLELKDYLDQIVVNNTNVEVEYCDFLQSDLLKKLEQYSYEYLYFVSNVPYYITTPIIMKLMNLSLSFTNIVMMVQKEVGERFSSLPGCREYGSISVYLNYFYQVEKVFDVGREYFTPVPNVDSVVVSFIPRKERLFVKDQAFFFRIVRDSFQFKRKTLRNNLKDYDLNLVSLVLSKFGYDLTVRAENLSVEVFVELSNALFSSK